MTSRLSLPALAASVAFASTAFAQTAIPYQKPPAAIEQLLDAPPTPVATVSPDRTLLLIEQPADFPTIADVALYTYTAHAPEGGVALDAYPAVRDWLSRVEGLPGFVPMAKTAVGLCATGQA